METYDVVVIGSGAGGLSAAVALANAGRHVLVLEQHYQPGGWCHSFTRGGFLFSPGVHYIGELEPGGLFRDVLRGLGVTDRLELCEINPDGFDHLLVAGQRLDVPAGRERYRQRLAERFPAERGAIGRYFRLLYRVCSEFMVAGDYARGLRVLQLPLRAPNFLIHGSRALAPYLDHLTRDPWLKAFLTAPSGIYGQPPSSTTLLLHSILTHHYGQGAYYPRGGAGSIPAAFIARLRARGGELRTACPVDRILLERGRAVGVKLRGGEEIRARQVVSNGDPEMTFARLVGREHLPAALCARLDRTRYSMSCLSLFLATDLDLRAMGLDSGNYWYYARPDVEASYQAMLRGVPDPIEAIFLSVPTLKDPGLRDDGLHTIEVFALVPHAPFARWAGQADRRRDADYQALKEDLTRRLLAAAERVIPGLSEHLVFQELGTPLTNEHFVRSHLGAMYGTDKTRDQVGTRSYPTRTPIEGLWMVGASTFFHGVMGASVSGVIAASELLGRSFERVLDAGGPEPLVHAADAGARQQRLAV